MRDTSARVQFRTIVRQKIILRLIERAGGKVARLNLVKWAFLFGQEYQREYSETYYQFLPYLHGPFSFTLYHEVDGLLREGILVAPTERTLELGTESNAADFLLSREIERDIVEFWSRYGSYSTERLLNTTYRQYPWYTLKSENPQKRNAVLPNAQCAVYTVGYEGMQIDGFLDRLLRAGIRQLIDVRNNPVSRRYGFHKQTLSRICERMDLRYQHIPELGIASEWRNNLVQSSDYARLFDRYEKEVLPAQSRRISEVAKSTSAIPTALVCQEADPSYCHRTRLGKWVSEITGLPLIHIGKIA